MTNLWAHQLNAVDFLRSHPHAILNHGMGTGKTLTTLTHVYEANLRRTLVLCPKAVITVWRDEIEKHSAGRPFKVVTLNKGTTAAKSRLLAQALSVSWQGALFVVTNYESAWRKPLSSHLRFPFWDLLVLDEIHRIKSPGGKASRYCYGLSPRSNRRIGLTGTLMPHSPLDVYAQFRAIDNRIFGTSFNAFKHRYAVFGGYGGYEIQSYQNTDEMCQKIDLITHMVSSDVLDLPPVRHIAQYCGLGPQAHKVYQALARDFVAYLNSGTVTATNSLTRLLRFAQVTSGHLRQDDGTIIELDHNKYHLMKTTVEGTPEDEPWVIFCRFKHDVERVHRMGRELGRKTLELSGDCNQLERWQAGDAPILAAQIQAGSLGVSFVRAKYCGYYSLGFNLGEYDQSQKRIHRPGQTEKVTYYHWLVGGVSIDTHIMSALQAKTDVVNDIMRKAKRGALFSGQPEESDD